MVFGLSDVGKEHGAGCHEETTMHEEKGWRGDESADIEQRKSFF